MVRDGFVCSSKKKLLSYCVQRYLNSFLDNGSHFLKPNSLPFYLHTHSVSKDIKKEYLRWFFLIFNGFFIHYKQGKKNNHICLSMFCQFSLESVLKEK